VATGRQVLSCNGENVARLENGLPTRLRIAQIAPLAEPVPPTLYGGIERVVSAVTEQLVSQGHEVVLFASGDSKTAAELVPLCAKAVRLNGSEVDHVSSALEVIWSNRARLEGVDIIHFHTELLRFRLFREIRGRCVTTVHMQKNWPDTRELLRACPSSPYIAISKTQRETVFGVNWIGTVHHGLSPGLFHRTVAPKCDYLAFLGRVSPEKGLARAIDIAHRVRMRLRIAAKVGDSDRQYFQQVIEPLIDGERVEFCGEIDDVQKQDFLGNAAAMLFPVAQPEPFGLCLIEAMACGTPVIAFPLGAVPEIVESNITGLLVNSVEEAAAAVPRARWLDRARIRKRFEARFSAARMTEQYVEIYSALAGNAPCYL
jgi:glycosyltransferase involved in cell wall biosynthesis